MRVGQRAQSVIFLLAGSVPKPQIDHLSVELDGGGIVIEHSGHIFGGELVLGIATLSHIYDIRMQVLPTAPSPTTTSLIAKGSYDIIVKIIALDNKNVAILPALSYIISDM